ncbi:MAG: efflux RND transporter periplasmic adaptor subunit [Alphaproteobacteria bacterium]|jgi:RND family efflux transporter MFP subunit|nr:efflux RND transporter periplasmic adaptor subunit [Alphaproteobacteria bacterium]
MSFARQLVILVVLAAAAAGGWYVWRGGAGEAASDGARAPTTGRAPAPVVVERVRFASDAAIVEAIGTGRAAQAVELSPEAAGRVVEILVEPRARVEAGAPLVKLDAERERLAVELARVELGDARRQLDRFERIAPGGAVSESQVDSARVAVASAEIALRQAELALAERTVRAPFAGVVGIAEVDVGDRVDEETEIASFDDVSAILVDFEVPEAFLAGIARGAELELRSWARRGERFTARVEAIAARIDPVARTVRVRARAANPERRLKPGMSFAVRLPLAGERFPSVPSIAVRWEREGAFVWRVAAGRAQRVPVEVLKRSDGHVLVDGGLEAGDRVVVEGLQRLRPGREVVVRDGAEVAAVTAGSDGG